MNPSIEPAVAAVDRARCTVLIVEDDDATRYATRRHLESVGFMTLEAGSGDEALQLADRADAVLLDVHMPGMSGHEVCSQLRSRAAHDDLVILQYSGVFIKDEDKIQGLRRGADAYLAKPVDEDVLVANLDALFRNRQRIRQLDDKLQQTRVQEDRARDLFLAILGHDLRSPLDSIMMGAMLLLRTEESSPTGLRTAARILSSGGRMKEMIDDLHDYARARLGSPPVLHRERVSLGELVRACVEELEATMPSARLVLRADADPAGEWDRQRLFRVVMNLLRNAAQYGRSDEAIVITIDEGEDHAILSIENAGDPIGPGALSQIFEPMVRAAAHPGQPGQNLGLGLFICRQIAEEHGGSITVRSDQDGTRFTVTLPRLA